MKKYYKIVLCFIFILLLGGCKDSAKGSVEKYLAKYNSLDEEVLKDATEIMERENLNDTQKEKYIDILKKQYSDLKYSILNEEYDGDEATIKVKVTVYDLYKAQKNASEYLEGHADNFNDDDGNYDISKYIDFKLKLMNEMMDTVDYTIDFYVIKTKDGWVVSSLSNADLEKIHGIYNYES